MPEQRPQATAALAAHAVCLAMRMDTRRVSYTA
eukprot:COSAG05_NODE_14072_length_409_cov_0.664516_2_plen_32_part_01